MSINKYFRGIFLKTREKKTHKNSSVFRPIFDRRGGLQGGLQRGLQGGSADNVYLGGGDVNYDV